MIEIYRTLLIAHWICLHRYGCSCVVDVTFSRISWYPKLDWTCIERLEAVTTVAAQWERLTCHLILQMTARCEFVVSIIISSSVQTVMIGLCDDTIDNCQNVKKKLLFLFQQLVQEQLLYTLIMSCSYEMKLKNLPREWHLLLGTYQPSACILTCKYTEGKTVAWGTPTNESRFSSMLNNFESNQSDILPERVRFSLNGLYVYTILRSKNDLEMYLRALN